MNGLNLSVCANKEAKAENKETATHMKSCIHKYKLLQFPIKI